MNYLPIYNILYRQNNIIQSMVELHINIYYQIELLYLYI